MKELTNYDIYDSNNNVSDCYRKLIRAYEEKYSKKILDKNEGLDFGVTMATTGGMLTER